MSGLGRLHFDIGNVQWEAAAANKSLHRTFDPPPVFAAAKSGIASYSAECGVQAQS